MEAYLEDLVKMLLTDMVRQLTENIKSLSDAAKKLAGHFRNPAKEEAEDNRMVEKIKDMCENVRDKMEKLVQEAAAGDVEAGNKLRDVRLFSDFFDIFLRFNNFVTGKKIKMDNLKEQMHAGDPEAVCNQICDSLDGFNQQLFSYISDLDRKTRRVLQSDDTIKTEFTSSSDFNTQFDRRIGPKQEVKEEIILIEH